MESITRISWLMYVSAGLIGYLAGSLSFARILTRLITRSSHIEGLKEQVPGSDQTFESDSVSATVITQNLGKKFGCLTALLDMFKVALPTFLVQYFFRISPISCLRGFLVCWGMIIPYTTASRVGGVNHP